MLAEITEICKLMGTKAKAVQDEKGHVYVYDCFHWSEECAHMLRFMLPDAVLSVESAVTSLSGFVLVLHQQPHRLCRRRMLSAIFITILIYIVLLVCYVWL